jgi:Uri superfamily endonuclease
VYALLIRLERTCTIVVGALGPIRFEAGDYLYAGSAKSGLSSRIARHLRAEKRLRWHIDYLLRRATVRDVYTEAWAPGAECSLAERALRSGFALPGPRGFGSSDCRCPSHLLRLRARAGDGWREMMLHAR